MANTDDVTYTGQFQCKDTETCTVERTGGKVTTLTNYEFVPSATQTETVMEKAVDKVDTDYLTFGVWLKRGHGFTAGRRLRKRKQRQQQSVHWANILQGLGGSATYRGPAVGVYTDGSSVEHFDGNAELTANFGDPSVVADPNATPAVDQSDGTLGTIEGTIDINGGGNTPAGTVTLGRANMTADGPFDRRNMEGSCRSRRSGDRTVAWLCV